MLGLKPPAAALMVETRKERVKALVRQALVALSASIAVQDEANIASEKPERIAVPRSSEIFVPTIAKRVIAAAETTPPLITKGFLP